MAEHRNVSSRLGSLGAGPIRSAPRRRSQDGGGSRGAAAGERGPRTDERDAADTDTPALDQQVVFWIFVALTIGVTVFQKIGYLLNAKFAIPLIMMIAYPALALGVLFARPVFRPERVMLYLAVVVVSALSTIFLARGSSLASMGLYLLLYLPLLVTFETTRTTYLRCLRFFSTVMLVFAVIVWLEHAVQISIGWQYWPNLDKLVPRSFLVPEFNYIQPIEWNLNLMKPSAISFLEVSILSQFLTFALLMELLYLQRTWRAVFFGATLFATFAGTGLILLAVSLPLVFSRMNSRTFFIVLATTFVALFVALELHWFDLVAHRLGEFQQANTSGNSRFVAPLDRIRQALADPRGVYAGVGAGQIEQGGNTFWWPMVKISVEYGLVEGILFYFFYLFCMLDHTPSRQLAFVLAIWFSFEGTLSTPLNPIGCVMLSTMFFMTDGKRVRRRASRSGSTGAAGPANG